MIELITLKELNADMNYSMLALHKQQVKDVHNAIDPDSVRSLDELTFREEEGELQDAAVFYDKNLVAALENLLDIDNQILVELVNKVYGERVDIFYIAEDDMYAVIYYQG